MTATPEVATWDEFAAAYRLGHRVMKVTATLAAPSNTIISGVTLYAAGRVTAAPEAERRRNGRAKAGGRKPKGKR